MNIWRYPLTGVEIGALERLLGHVHAMQPDDALQPAPGVPTLYRALPRPGQRTAHVLDLRGHDTDHAVLAALADRLRAVADPAAPHVALIEHLPTAHNPAALMLLIGTLFGEVTEFAGHGAPVAEITDRGRMVGRRPSSDNALEFQLHTDLSFHPAPPGFIAFLMLAPGTGGESVFCDPQPVLQSLPEAAIAALQTPFRFPPSLHRPDMGPQYFPILRRDPGRRFDIRFRRDGLEPQNKAQEHALLLLERGIDTAAIEVALGPGELTLFSNRFLLHGRRGFRSQVEQGPRRSALRAYVDKRPGM